MYKCFLPQAWSFANERGVSAFVHPEGVYDDPRGGALPSVSFDTLANLYEVDTIEQCYDDSITGPVPGIKDEDGWCVKGHPDRIIHVGQKELKLFAKLFDDGQE